MKESKPFSLISLPRVNDPRGNLSFVQGGGDLPFEIERAYWIYDVPGDMSRYGRALRNTSELIIALAGSFDVEVDDGDGVKHTVHLRRSYEALLLPPMRWRQITNFSTCSVALVLASTTYDADDYISDYHQFLLSKNS